MGEFGSDGSVQLMKCEDIPASDLLSDSPPPRLRRSPLTSINSDTDLTVEQSPSHTTRNDPARQGLGLLDA